MPFRPMCDDCPRSCWMNHGPVKVARSSGVHQSLSLPSCATARPRDRATAKRWIERGAARVALVIPPEYQRNTLGGHTGVAQMLIDVADPQSSGAAISGAQFAAHARDVHRAGDRRHSAHDLDDFNHEHRNREISRARHARATHRHSDQSHQPYARQADPVRPRWLRPDVGDPSARCALLRHPDHGPSSVALRAGLGVHRV